MASFGTLGGRGIMRAARCPVVSKSVGPGDAIEVRHIGGVPELLFVALCGCLFGFPFGGGRCRPRMSLSVSSS